MRAEFVFEHMRGFGKCLVDVAAAQLGGEREVGVLLALEVLEVGEAAGRLELVVHIGFRRHGFDFVVDRLHFLVFGDDGVGGSFGDVRVGGEHHRDRLADETDLFHRQDRLIVERWAVIGIGDDLDDILCGDDAIDAGHFFRRAGVDRFDAAMRDGRTEDLAVQHAGQTHQMRVLGAAGDLFARFEARHRAADLAAPYRIGGHRRFCSLLPQCWHGLRPTPNGK